MKHMKNTQNRNVRTTIYPIKASVAVTNIHPRKRIDGQSRSRTGGFIAWPEGKKTDRKPALEEGGKA